MTRSATFAARSALTLSLVSLVAMTPAVASTVLPAPSPAPAPAPSGGVAGPPDGMIAPPPPQGQRPFPSIGTFPTPAPGPTVRPSQPQPPQATPAPRPAPAPQPGAARQPATPSAPQPREAPATVTTADPLPPATPSPPEIPASPATGGTPTEIPPAPQPSAESAWPEWLPLAAVGGAAALLGGGWLLWQRRRKTLALPAPQRVERAAPPPPPRQKPTVQPSPRPAPASAPTALGRRADLEIAFEALSAQSTLLNLRIRYAVTVRNSGQIAAEPVTVRIGLFAGSQVHPQGIAQWFALEGQPLHHAAEVVPAGSDYRFEGELAAPLDALNPVTIDGRVLAIPLVAIDARYGHGEGEAPIEGQSARAFVIGRDPQREGAKLAPFRLDQGPTSFAPLGQRDAGISKVA